MKHLQRGTGGGHIHHDVLMLSTRNADMGVDQAGEGTQPAGSTEALGVNTDTGPRIVVAKCRISGGNSSRS